MLIPFGIVLGTGFFFIYCAWRRASLLNSNPPSNRPPASAVAEGLRSSPFEQPSRWLAVKASDPSVVQAALRLNRPTACSWEEGLAEARQDKLFISPPISGWVLVVGPGLPEPAEDVDSMPPLSNRTEPQAGPRPVFQRQPRCQLPLLGAYRKGSQSTGLTPGRAKPCGTRGRSLRPSATWAWVCFWIRDRAESICHSRGARRQF